MTADVLAHLLDLERALMQPDVRRSAERLHALIRDDFFEIGASGRTYTRAELTALLAIEPGGPAAAISDFKVQHLSPDIALVTYRTDLNGIARLRSSIWRREKSAWRMQFHQGTPTS